MKNQKTLLITVFIASLFFLSLLAVKSKAARPVNVPSKNNRIFTLPNTAVRLQESLYYLGKSKDKDGKDVEGYAIIHYKNKNAKNNNPAKGAKNQCYGFLADGAKWKTIEPWIVNTLNTRGLTESAVFNNLTSSIDKWEDAADSIVGNSNGINILGSGSITSDVIAADTVSPDNLNEVYFADVADSNAIAVTIVWGVFGGPKFQRSLVEWDQVYDDIDYDWSSAGEAGKMDFENIAIHELGHSVGLNDLYTSSCSQETMYGYASNGEINKRDLNTGDIKGISELY